MSTAVERLQVVYLSYNGAYARRPDDLQACQTAQQAQAVLDNVDSLERTYLTAAKQALDATGPAIEAAYEVAVSARDQVERAYADAQALAARITAVAHCASSVATLIQKAAG